MKRVAQIVGWCLVSGLVSVVLMAGECGSGGSCDTWGGDPCNCYSEGDPCGEDYPWGAEVTCKVYVGPWCGTERNKGADVSVVASLYVDQCACQGGTWTCFEPQPPTLCHDCCQEAEESELHFCASDGSCIEASACLAESCCVPGSSGDTYCQATYGDGSSCVAGDSSGNCDPM